MYLHIHPYGTCTRTELETPKGAVKVPGHE